MQAASPSFAQLTPAEADKEVFRLSQHLKPIDNERWKEIAGARMTEKYRIARGDTLSGISKRLFGDSRYWPKIWALNNDTITNPHLIKQGNAIAFLPGSGTELPRVAIQTAGDVNDERSAEAMNTLPPEEPEAQEGEELAPEPKRRASQEWRKLPHQRWEDLYEPPAAPRVVYKDIDIDEKARAKVSQIKFELPAYASTEPFESLGKVIGANTPANLLAQGNLIYIRSDERVKIGDIYDITSDPVVFKELTTHRATYSYPLQGRVKIIKKHDGIYLGQIISSLNIATRDSFLIPAHPRISILSPIPGPSDLKARVLIDHRDSTYAVAQFKEVFIDRGSDDGIAPGMVFRIYQTRDEVSRADLDEANFVTEGEIMVVQVSERLSAAIVTQSHFPIFENSEVHLVTEQGTLQNIPPLKEKAPEDDLEKLNGPDQLEEQEKRELKQLERWKGNPSPTPSPEPVTPPVPEATPSASPLPSPTPVPVPPPAPSPTPELPPPPPPQEVAPPSPAPETAPTLEITPGPVPTESSPPAGETPIAPPAESAAPPPPPPTEGSTPPIQSGESKALDTLLGP